MNSRVLLLLCVAVALLPLAGCADVHVELGCQKTAPTLTNAPTHIIEKSPVCGLHRN
ncbi:MAG: hypothetical protein ACYCPO_06580 [Acidobacteriaceae bacterium]